MGSVTYACGCYFSYDMFNHNIYTAIPCKEHWQQVFMMSMNETAEKIKSVQFSEKENNQ